MAIELQMPKNGMDMEEGTIVKWLKNVGDPVEKGEAVMEIETDKITMESEAPASGVLLAKLYEEGAVVPVLTTIGYIGQPGEQVPGKEAGEAEASAVVTGAPAEAEKTSQYDYDVAVIGGGPAGYVGAIRAAQLGAKVVIFEKDVVGGTCLNRGCIPTKTYLKTAEYIHHIEDAANRGIIVDPEHSVDMTKVVAYKNKVVKQLTGGVDVLLKRNGVTKVSGEAALEDAHTIACASKTYTADKILLCGGSKAIRIPIPGVDHKDVMTSNEILDMEEVPARLGIIGGGVIGCELASAFSAFGSKVTIIEAMDSVVSMLDRDISKEVDKTLKKAGCLVNCGRKVVEIKDNNGCPVIVTDNGEFECDKVLLSIGRAADLSCLGKMEGQFEINRGKVVVDDTMKTKVDNIYACGDINGRIMLAHSAFKMAEVAAENAVKGTNETCDLRYVPSVLYLSPECASVGLSEQKAKEKHPEGIRVGKFNMSGNGRSVASGETSGFVKVVADNKYGEILGVHIVGGVASEMIAEATALLQMEITINEVAEKIIHAHPSYSEAFQEACADCLGLCIHQPPKRK